MSDEAASVVTPMEKTERTVNVQGIATHVFEAGPPAASPLLYLHGTHLGNLWLDCHNALAQNFHVFAPDTPGFGLTERPDWMRDMSDYVLFFRDLLNELGLDQVMLVGHSLGGWMAAELAVWYPERVKKLVLSNAVGIRVKGTPIADLFAMNPQELMAASFDNLMAAMPLMPAEFNIDYLLAMYRERTTLASLAWNPLVLLEVAANAHNDVLMVSFTLLALVLLARSSNAVLSSASFTLGVLVKYLSGLGLVWVYVAAAARTTSWRSRVFRTAAMVVVSVLLVLAVAAPWLELPDSLGPLLDETAGVGYVNSIPDSVALAVADRLSAPVELTRTLERLLALGSFIVYLVWEWRRVWSEATPAAVARALARSSLIYIVAVSTSVQTWYYCLPVAVAVALGCRWRVTQLTLAYSVLALPALYLSYYLRDGTPLWVNLVYGLAPLVLLVPELAARARARPHVPATETVGDDEQRPRRHGATPAVVEESSR